MMALFRQTLAVILSFLLLTPSCIAEGNTTASQGTGYVYDFENRLVQAGAGISIVYDGEGNRVSKTNGGLTTTYLVDDQNPTGYAQVLHETVAGSFSGNRYKFKLPFVIDYNGTEQSSARRKPADS